MTNEEKILSLLTGMQADISGLKEGQAKLEAGQAKLEAGQAKLELRLDDLEAGQEKILRRLDMIENDLRYLEKDVHLGFAEMIRSLDKRTEVLESR